MKETFKNFNQKSERQTDRETQGNTEWKETDYHEVWEMCIWGDEFCDLMDWRNIVWERKIILK